MNIFSRDIPRLLIYSIYLLWLLALRPIDPMCMGLHAMLTELWPKLNIAGINSYPSYTCVAIYLAMYFIVRETGITKVIPALITITISCAMKQLF